MPRDSHPSIEAIRIEEPEWKAIGFKEPNLAILEVGRHAKDGYYARGIKGTSDVAFLPDLEAVEPRAISPDRALKLRETYDSRWRRREETADKLTGLLRADFFDDADADLLTGHRFIGVTFGREPGCTVAIEPNGSVQVRVDEPAYIVNNVYVDWHEYRLRRTSPYVEHEIHPEGMNPETRLIVETSKAMNYVLGVLGDVQAVTTDRT